MTKVVLDVSAFKALASETRLDILKALDGKKMGLTAISNVTKLHKVTLHEHLEKLTEAGLVKRDEREGHKWVYYRLSWKGESLLHPENTKIVVMFTSTFIALSIGVISLIHVAQELLGTESVDTGGLLQGPPPGSEPGFTTVNPVLLPLTIGCLVAFTILLTISFRKYKKNKIPRL
jgi:DNA-binding transcriptional ArsR family regulator